MHMTGCSGIFWTIGPQNRKKDIRVNIGKV